MRKFIVACAILSQTSVFGQIKVSVIENYKEEKKVENIDKVPIYDSIQNFFTYGTYCENLNNLNQDKHHGETEKWIKPCDINLFYKRYVGLQIYYPDYTNDYRNHEIYLFKKLNYDSISWTHVGNKTYKIVDINAGSDNFPQINILKSKYPYIDFNKESDYGLFFILKDIASNDTICVFDNSTKTNKFILVPYYNTLKTKFLGKEFKVKNYRSTLINVLRKNGGAIIEENQTLKCKDILVVNYNTIYDCNEYCPCSYDSRTDCNQDITILYVLTENDKTYYFDDSNQEYEGIEPSFSHYFMLKSKYEKDIKNAQIKEQQQDKAKLNNLITKYGKTYGALIYNNKITIGMTKSMCEEVWGISSSCNKFTSAKGVILICRYSNGTLKFSNGVLSEIIQ